MLNEANGHFNLTRKKAYLVLPWYFCTKEKEGSRKMLEGFNMHKHFCLCLFFDSAKHRAVNPPLKLQSEVGYYVTGLLFECLDQGPTFTHAMLFMLF